MTAGEIVDQIMRLLAGGNVADDFAWDRREILAAIGQARDARIKISMFEDGRMNDSGYDLFPEMLAVYFAEVKCDEKRNRHYITLPVRFLGGLPQNRGLYQISFPQSEESAFIQTRPNFVSGYTGLDSSKENIGVSYWPEGERTVWLNRWRQEYTQEVMIKLIPRTEDLDETDELPMPGDLLQGVVDDVVKRYLRQFPQDKINDSNSQVEV